MTVEEWNHLAQRVGFNDRRAMLDDWYNNQGFSLREIGKILKVHTNTVHRMMIQENIPRRGTGGPHNKGNHKLANISNEILFENRRDVLAEALECSPSTVYNERKRRESNEEKVNKEG